MNKNCDNCQFHNRKQHCCKFGMVHKHIDPNEAKYECCTQWHELNNNYEGRNNF